MITDKPIKFLFVDLFAGAGGVTTGICQAERNGLPIAKVIAAVNHNETAIASHSANHPETLHFIEDIRTLNLSKLIRHVKSQQQKYPEAKLCLWASLECTHFSRARGGLSRSPDSRTLAEHLDRYILALSPDAIFIENVEEFMSWGELDENGKPVSKREGIDYIRWVESFMDMGYSHDWRILNVADYGAYTNRKRYFGIFARSGFPIAFPLATHARTPKGEAMFGSLQKWKPVREVLDFSVEGNSIFRNKPLAEKSLKRIYAGLQKYIVPGENSFMVKYLGNNQKTGINNGKSLNEPCFDLVQTFLASYYGSGDNCSEMNKPCPTLTTKDRISLISVYWLDKQYGSGVHNHQSVNVPAGVLTSNPPFALMNAYFIMPQSVGTITCDQNNMRRQIIYTFRRNPKPVHITVSGNFVYFISIYDSAIMQKIKFFMFINGLLDVKMRMLLIDELKLITGFPVDYILRGTQVEQKKAIGNAVPVLFPQRWIETLSDKLPDTNATICHH